MGEGGWTPGRTSFSSHLSSGSGSFQKNQKDGSGSPSKYASGSTKHACTSCRHICRMSGMGVSLGRGLVQSALLLGRFTETTANITSDAHQADRSPPHFSLEDLSLQSLVLRIRAVPYQPIYWFDTFKVLLR